MLSKLELSETNIANFGTDLEYRIKLESAEGEPAFAGFLKGVALGTYLWRVRKFKLEVAATSDFFRGDCYLALTATGSADVPVLTIFYWIGDSTSIDEAGVVAYKAFELDNVVTAVSSTHATQYREVCGAESARFRAAFPGMRILEGGYDSGFHTVTAPERKKRLLRVWKDRLEEVPRTWSSLESDGVYIFDAGTVIYQWTGSASKTKLRAPAMAAARALDDTRGIQSTVIVLSAEEQGADFNRFVEELSGGENTKTLHKNRTANTNTRRNMVWENSHFAEVSLPANGQIWIEDKGTKCTVHVPAGTEFLASLCAMAYFNHAGRDPVTTRFQFEQ
jgi:hypothetical protein